MDGVGGREEESVKRVVDRSNMREMRASLQKICTEGQSQQKNLVGNGLKFRSESENS